MTTLAPAVGTPVSRLEGVAKVSGAARYAVEYPVADVAYAWLVQATIAKGTIRRIDASAALGLAGVLAVLTHENAPRLQQIDDTELLVLQRNQVAYRGQIVSVVVADTLERARAAAEALRVEYDPAPHDVLLAPDHPKLYKPDHVNPAFETDTDRGDVDAALTSAAAIVDATYSTPAEHNNPMEPHAATAIWDGDRLTVYDSSQGVTRVHATLAQVFGLDRSQVRVVSEHVGGGFGSKGVTRPPTVIAAMAAREVGRPVRCVTTRQQMFAFVGYRTPTIQRVRLGADADGRLTAVAHEVVEQTSTLREFAEQTAVGTRMMYRAPNLRTSHRLAALDVPTPHWMRAPGEAPGMYALESAMDELAVALGIDPVELRVRNEPERDYETGEPFTSRGLVTCLQEGAARFGWAGRDPRPGQRLEGRWLAGTGVASSTYPARTAPATATLRANDDGTFTVLIAAADIGTGARTAITQIAADELGVPVDRVQVRIADSDFGPAMIAGGSMGTTSWGWAVTKACRELSTSGGSQVRVDTSEDIKSWPRGSRHAFGAQFAEVRVDIDTGEIRVPRLLGVFACGRVVNPATARSQLIGGMTWGLSMALHEESVMDPNFGDYVNHDFAGYHIPVNADVHNIEAHWVDEADTDVNPLGIKGIGEIGIVGTAAAIANAVYHATGLRVRDLPIQLDKLLDSMA